jgi:hypothetical protein
MLYILLHNLIAMGEYNLIGYNLISPAYYLLKVGWYYYRVKRLKTKTKTIVVEQTYNKEEDFVHLEMTEMSI